MKLPAIVRPFAWPSAWKSGPITAVTRPEVQQRDGESLRLQRPRGDIHVAHAVRARLERNVARHAAAVSGCVARADGGVHDGGARGGRRRAVDVGAVIPLQAANNVATSRATTTCRPIREIGREELMLKKVQRECRMRSMALTRMTWFAWKRCCVTPEALAAHARGNGRGGGSRSRHDGVRKKRAGDVKLRPGDLAPDFTLPGSDGRTYHLREIVGRDTAW